MNRYFEYSELISSVLATAGAYAVQMIRPEAPRGLDATYFIAAAGVLANFLAPVRMLYKQIGHMLGGVWASVVGAALGGAVAGVVQGLSMEGIVLEAALAAAIVQLGWTTGITKDIRREIM